MKKLVIILIFLISIFIADYLFKLIVPEKWSKYTDPEEVIGITLLYPNSWKVSWMGDSKDSNGVKILFIEKSCPFILQWQGCPILSISRSISNQHIGYSLADVASIDYLQNKKYILRNETVSKIDRVKIAELDAIMFDKFAKFGDIGVGSTKIERNYLFYKDDILYDINYSEPVYLGSLFVPKNSDEWRYFDTAQKVIDSILIQ